MSAENHVLHAFCDLCRVFGFGLGNYKPKEEKTA